MNICSTSTTTLCECVSYRILIWSEWILAHLTCSLGFPGSSAGKEPAYNVGDPGLIPESGRSPGEGIGYPFQYYWASLVDQLLQNLPVMWETWVQSLGWEDPLEKGKAAHSSILAWRIPWTTVHGGHKELDTTEQLSQPTVQMVYDVMEAPGPLLLASWHKAGFIIWVVFPLLIVAAADYYASLFTSNHGLRDWLCTASF